MDKPPGDDSPTPAEVPEQHDGEMPLEPIWSDPMVPFAVLGLSAPRLAGRLHRIVAGTLFHDVELDFGEGDGLTAGRFITVTSRPSHRRRALSRADHLAAALRLTRARLSETAGTAAGGPTEAALSDVEHSFVMVDGRRVACLLRRLGDLWAIEAYLSAEVLSPGPGSPSTAVTLVARGIDLSDVQLAPVSDLASFREAAGGAGVHTQDRVEPPRSKGPEPAPFESIGALVLASLDPAPDVADPAEVHAWMLGLHRLWTPAHRAQMHFAGQNPAAAAGALTSMVDHMRTLSGSVPWWQEAGTDAVAESVRHSVFSSEVPSQAAQDHWTWGIRNPADAERWLQAWDWWFSQRPRRAHRSRRLD